MENLIQDLRYSLRTLLKKPLFTIVAIITLALGIGANTAIFSVVNSVLLRSLPYKEANRLVMVWENNRTRGRATNVINPANFLDWQQQNTVFEGMSALYDSRFNLTGAGDPEEISGQVVSTNFFSLLGTQPMLGRGFLDSEGIAGQDNVAVISYGLWQRRFGGSPDILEKSIIVDGQSVNVVGVMPADFNFLIKSGIQVGNPADVWTPMVFTDNFRLRRGRFMMSVARIKPGITFEQAQAEMTGIANNLEQQYPNFNTGWGINLVPVAEQLVGDLRRPLIILLSAVGFVLLIACANVANLMLSRAASRQKEIAIRSAMGAGRARIIRQLLTETILLSLVSGSVGLLLALWGVDALMKLAPRQLVPLQQVGLNYGVMLFTFLLSVLTGVIFGLAPALTISRTNLNEALKEGGKGSGSDTSNSRVRNLFVVAEVALALILLIGSGLMLKSFYRLQSVNPGFDATNLLTFKLALPGSKYPDDAKRLAFFKEASERIKSLPSVRSVGAINFMPFTGLGAATGFEIEGRPAPTPAERPTTESRVVDPNYFETMGIMFLDGRNFNPRETAEMLHVVIINETLAEKYFPGENPLGKRVTIYMKGENLPCEIIGIVRDVKHHGLTAEPRAMAYWPQPELVYPFMTLAVRTNGDPLNAVGAIQREIQTMDKDQPLADVRTMESWIGDSVATTRFAAVLLTLFAAVALILACVGIYGVLAYSVTQRTHEIGIRVALGAKSIDVLQLIVGSGMKLTAIGIVIGLVAAFSLTRVMESLLFGVSTTDLLTFLSVPALLLGVALVACLVPARRAARTDPMVALRYE
jgi:putative ABC transport system permease protein